MAMNRKEVIELFLELGIKTIPVIYGAKTPDCPHGYKDASLNYNVDSYKEDKKNFGVVTGEPLADGSQLVIIDIDDKNLSLDSKLFIKEEVETWGETLKVHSASQDSYHLYFSYDGDLDIASFDIVDGIQVLSKGRYAVAPTSYNSLRENHYKTDASYSSIKDIETLPQIVEEKFKRYLERKVIADKSRINLDHVSSFDILFIEKTLLELEDWIQKGNKVDHDLFKSFVAVSARHAVDVEDLHTCFKACGAKYDAAEIDNLYQNTIKNQYPYTMGSLYHYVKKLDLDVWKHIDHNNIIPDEVLELWKKKHEEKNTNKGALPLVPSGFDYFDKLRETIYNAAPHKYPSFVDATALCFITTHLQMLVNTPTGSNISLYQSLVAETGIGKGFYTKIIKTAFDGLVIGNPRSAGGLHNDIKKLRNCMLVLEEASSMTDVITRESGGNSFISLLCTLFNLNETFHVAGDSAKTKEYTTESFTGGALGIFNTMTPPQMKTAQTDKARGGGLTNRNLYYEAIEYAHLEAPNFRGDNLKLNEIYMDFVNQCQNQANIKYLVKDGELEHNDTAPRVSPNLERELENTIFFKIQDLILSTPKAEEKVLKRRLNEITLRIATAITSFEILMNQKRFDAIDKSYISIEALEWALKVALSSVELTVKNLPEKKETSNEKHARYKSSLEKQFKKLGYAYYSKFIDKRRNNKDKLEFLEIEKKSGLIRADIDKSGVIRIYPLYDFCAD